MEKEMNRLNSAILIKNTNGTWSAIVKEMDTSRNKIEKKYNQLPNTNFKAAALYLISHGVLPSEIEYALTVLQQQEHNYAHFGIVGAFLYSEYVGVLQ